MPGYRSILVHLDASPHGAERLDLARRLALEHDTSALIGLLALEPREAPAPLSVDIAPPIPPKVFEVDPEHRRRARTIFDDAMRSGGPPMTWAEATDPQPERGVAKASRCADLTVLGQRDPDDAFSTDVPGDLVESVAMDSGKPVLVVPFTDRFPHIPRNVLVAWKNTRECARTVEAALPLMRRAEDVRLVSWGEEPIPPYDEEPLGIVAYLRRHGIEAIAHRYAGEPLDVGEALLAHAAEHARDLLVMGCYGHHRVRELLLGGATRTVLRSMTLPVLMSH
jgi:nucleotide-binding universal stress UspA family protein